MSVSYISRAGEKLAFALSAFEVDVSGKVCADFGSSTGGFVDCLLKQGAAKVYSIDTAYGELAWNLRKDPRVVVLERTNALHVQLPELVDFASVDVGWTKQSLILPHVLKNLKTGGQIVSLIKLHYEMPSNQLVKGVVPSEKVEEFLEQVLVGIKQIPGLSMLDIVESPILGSRGKNREFLVFLSKL